jgi:hypothetical protein
MFYHRRIFLNVMQQRQHEARYDERRTVTFQLPAQYLKNGIS